MMNEKKNLSRLPETEFEVMQEIWSMIPPVTTSLLMESIGAKKSWKLQTLTTLLNRLIERGFLRTEKQGKERHYYPVIGQEDYIEFETAQFVELYHKNSFTSLINAFCSKKALSEKDRKELSDWLKCKEEEQQ